MVFRAIAPRQSIDDAGAIRCVAILAHLPFGVAPCDRYAQADDRLELGLDEVSRSVRDCPAVLLRLLVQIRQSSHYVE